MGGDNEEENDTNRKSTEKLSSQCGKSPFKKIDIRTRYWTFMFENLRRSVDAIYETCLADRSAIECREAIMILENYTKDFVALIEYLNVEEAWEKSERPIAIAWEVRKTVSSPTKQCVPSPRPKCRDAAIGTCESSDSVIVNSHDATLPFSSGSEQPDANEVEGGWKVVARSRGRKNSFVNSSSGQNSIVQVQNQSCSSQQKGHQESSSSKQQITAENHPEQHRPLRSPKPLAPVRQTKASLAKLAFSQNYLEELRWKEQYERQWRHGARRGPLPKKVSSLPLLSNYSSCRLDYSSAGVGSRCGGRNFRNCRNWRKYGNFSSADSLCSLESIKEDDNNDGDDNLISHVTNNNTQLNGATPPLVNGFPFPETNHRRSSLPPEAAQFCVQDQDAEDDQALQNLTEEERSLAEEEITLQQAIEAEERKSIAIEAQEAAAKEEADASNEESAGQSQVPVEEEPLTWQEIVDRWKAELTAPGVSWGDVVEKELSVSVRAPGQAAQIHDKLSSPSRKRPLKDTIQLQEQRQLRAEQIRLNLQEQRANRLKELSKRVEEVRAARESLMARKRELLESRMERAERNRSEQLKAIVKKAHDEDEKVQEIAFINTLEAGNKRHEVLNKHQDMEQRLQTIKDERKKRKKNELKARLAAAERRKALEAERIKKLNALEQKRCVREQIALKQRCQQERERILQAREKAKEREERLQAIQAAQQASTEELLQKIHKKQESTIKRYEENLELIKQRASEMSAPRMHNSVLSSDEGCATKAATPTDELPVECDFNLAAHERLQSSDSSGIFTAPEDNRQSPTRSTAGVDKKSSSKSAQATADKQQQKTTLSKRKRQTLRKKLQLRAAEYAQCATKQRLAVAPQNSKFEKLVKEICRLKDATGLCSTWLDADVRALERLLTELNLALTNKQSKDQECFVSLGGVDCLIQFLQLLEKPSGTVLPVRTLLNVISLLNVTVKNSFLVSLDLLYTNKTVPLTNCFVLQLQSLNNGFDDEAKEMSSYKAVCIALFSLFIDMLSNLIEHRTESISYLKSLPNGINGFMSMLQTFVSFLICSGLCDQICRTLSVFLNNLTDTVTVEALNFVNCLLKIIFVTRPNESSLPTTSDATHLVELLCATNCLGIPSLLYSFLLGPSTSTCSFNSKEISPQHLLELQLSPEAVTFVGRALELMNSFFLVSACGMESPPENAHEMPFHGAVALELRHCCSLLLSFCSRFENNTELLHELILFIGYFSVSCPENQALVQQGSHPSILRQLCLLPFKYFSDSQLCKVLFPTLISCTFDNAVNRQVVEEELSTILLADFIREETESFQKVVTEPQADALLIDPQKFDLKNRFSFSKWEAAVNYFLQK